jgi:hypothetical protein
MDRRRGLDRLEGLELDVLVTEAPIGSSGRRLAAGMNPSRDMLMSKTTLPIAVSRVACSGP